MADSSLVFESTTKNLDYLVACNEQFLANQRVAWKKAYRAGGLPRGMRRAALVLASCGSYMYHRTSILDNNARDYWMQIASFTSRDLDKGCSIGRTLLSKRGSADCLWCVVTLVGSEHTKTWQGQVESKRSSTTCGMYV